VFNQGKNLAEVQTKTNEEEILDRTKNYTGNKLHLPTGDLMHISKIPIEKENKALSQG
jgi:hypothetical protein